MALEPDLRDAIDRLYEVFGQYKLADFSPCPHCYPNEAPRIEAVIRNTRLRDLTLNELSCFYADGLLTWGDVNDFRALLPRLMELFAEYHLGEHPDWSGSDLELHMRVDADFALLRFPFAGWRQWSRGEQAAVEGYLFALWKAFLSTGEPGPIDAGSWADEGLPEAILRVVHDPHEYLRYWRTCDWRDGTRHLAWFAAQLRPDHAMWDDQPRESWEIVLSWFAARATRAQLEGAIRGDAPKDQAWEALLGLETLERGRNAITWDNGSWVPDRRSLARAEELGVQLPEYMLAKVTKRRR